MMQTLEYVDTNHPLYQYFNTLGMPNSKTEQYKKFPIKAILAKEYTLQELNTFHIIQGSKLSITNGLITEVPQNVNITFEEKFNPDLEHYDALYFMSHIFTSKVISIEVLEDSSFEIEHIFNKSQTLLPYRISITITKNKKVKVFESFHMNESTDSLFLYGVDANILANSTLTWIRKENREDGEANVIGSHKYNVSKQAALELKTFDFGSASSLHLYKIDLDNYAWIDALHLLLADKDARRGNVIQINHNSEYAKSVQEARSILKDTATGIFDSKIFVAHNAKYANAAQNSKAILLDENAHMYAKPQLEIYTDELEASHGSSIGTLDEDALFYLCSRGISLGDARKMLVLAFANTLVDTIDNEKYKTKIRTDFESVM